MAVELGLLYIFLVLLPVVVLGNIIAEVVICWWYKRKWGREKAEGDVEE